MKEEGALAVVICALCGLLFKVVRKSMPSLLMVPIILATTGTNSYYYY